MSLRSLVRSVDGRFASVSDTFMESKMSSFHVPTEIGFEPIIRRELSPL